MFDKSLLNKLARPGALKKEGDGGKKAVLFSGL